MTALPVHVALVDDTGRVPRYQLQAAAGAINEQIARDFGPIWHVHATVGAYDTAPPWTWAVHIREQLDEPGALGFHTDENGQPVAYVTLDGSWTVTASHETLEMLADPSGNRPHGGRLPAGVEEQYGQFGLKTHHSHVHYLLEVCDPPEARSYAIGDVQVSDFILPAWYFANPGTHTAFSFAGDCTTPREVADGGYASFAVRDNWWQVFNVGGQLTIRDLGRFDRARFSSLREFTDHHARAFRR